MYALDLGAGHQFQAEPLARAAEGAAFHDVFPTGGHFPPIEVLFVERDVAHQAGIGVHADAEHQPARLGLFRRNPDRQIAERIAGGRGNHRGLGIAEQVAGGGHLGHGPACRRTRGRVKALATAGTADAFPAGAAGADG